MKYDFSKMSADEMTQLIREATQEIILRKFPKRLAMVDQWQKDTGIVPVKEEVSYRGIIRDYPSGLSVQIEDHGFVFGFKPPGKDQVYEKVSILEKETFSETLQDLAQEFLERSQALTRQSLNYKWAVNLALNPGQPCPELEVV